MSPEAIPFQREADMLASIVMARGRLGGGRPLQPFFEVQTTRGVVDLLFADIDHAILKERRNARVGTLIEAAPVAVVHALSLASPEPRPMATKEIADLIPYTATHLRRSVLPSLESAGWVSRVNAREWLLRCSYRIPVRRLIAIEVKRSKWRSALRQAVPHTQFADATYVALDVTRTPASGIWEDAFALAGLGLLTVRATSESLSDPGASTVARIGRAARRQPRGFARAVVAERVAALSEAGASSGFVGHVFGRFVTTEWGSDPRLVANA